MFLEDSIFVLEAVYSALLCRFKEQTLQDLQGSFQSSLGLYSSIKSHCFSMLLYYTLR